MCVQPTLYADLYLVFYVQELVYRWALNRITILLPADAVCRLNCVSYVHDHVCVVAAGVTFTETWNTSSELNTELAYECSWAEGLKLTLSSDFVPSSG